MGTQFAQRKQRINTGLQGVLTDLLMVILIRCLAVLDLETHDPLEILTEKFWLSVGRDLDEQRSGVLVEASQY